MDGLGEAGFHTDRALRADPDLVESPDRVKMLAKTKS
jgi:hypothetical protein